MKKLLIILTSVIITALLCGCKNTNNNTAQNVEPIRGTGEMITRTLQVNDYDAVSISGGFVVVYQQSGTCSLEVSMQANLFEFIKADVQNRTLNIEFTQDVSTTGGNTPRLYISAPYITAFTAGGALTAENWNTLVTPRLTFTVNGSANGAINVGTEDLTMNISGGGNIELSGSADNARITSNGAVNVSAFGLSVQTAEISIMGAGNVDISVVGTLDAVISGTGRIRYDGEPNVTQTVTGAGTVIKR
jgi:hypothetical protein